MFMLEAMTYKVVLKVPPGRGLSAEDIRVQAWTNQCDRKHCDGTWHEVNLSYCGSEDGIRHQYGKSVIITGHVDFNFTFRLKRAVGDKWQWSHGWKQDGFTHVEPPRDNDKWTQGPDYDHIQYAIHLGNFIAATNAKECGFTHVLNVADNLDMIYPEGGVTYIKVSMQDGAHNPIDESKLQEAVNWLLMHDKDGNKVLVNCRAGIGRAGSVAVGFVFANNKSLSYEEAYEYVFSKRFVYPHAHLREQLYRLFPRK